MVLYMCSRSWDTEQLWAVLLLLAKGLVKQKAQVPKLALTQFYSDFLEFLWHFPSPAKYCHFWPRYLTHTKLFTAAIKQSLLMITIAHFKSSTEVKLRWQTARNAVLYDSVHKRQPVHETYNLKLVAPKFHLVTSSHLHE